MPLDKLHGVKLPASADFHGTYDQTDLGFGLALGYCYTDLIVHLRDGDMLELVTPTIRQGGVNTVFVMVCIHLILSVLKRKGINMIETWTAQSRTTSDHRRPCAGIQSPPASH